MPPYAEDREAATMMQDAAATNLSDTSDDGIAA